MDRNGSLVTGADVDYNGSPAGYTADPQENIVYIAAHDNQTLFDIGQYHHPVPTAMADRVRAQNVGNAITSLAQGVPFFHAGQDMLRSKSLDRDSFNSGDWFNRLDFTYQSNNWGVGLPVAEKNESNWPIQGPLLANPDLRPEPGDIEFNVAVTREWLQVRQSTPLFRLETAAEVQERVSFLNTGAGQIPGLIAMQITDPSDGAIVLDPTLDRVVALFNPTDETIDFVVSELAGLPLRLHDVLAESVDPVVATSSFDPVSGMFSIPARTAAVFVSDETPPEATASLDFVRGGEGSAWFRVGYSCSDISGIAATTAEINGVSVIDGEVVHLVTLDDPDATPRWRRSKKGKLKIWDFTFELVVTCEDTYGNVGTATVSPVFGDGPR